MALPLPLRLFVPGASAAHQFIKCKHKIKITIVCRRRRWELPALGRTHNGVYRRRVKLRITRTVRYSWILHQLALSVYLYIDDAAQVYAASRGKTPVRTHGKHDLPHVYIAKAAATGASAFAAATATVAAARR